VWGFLCEYAQRRVQCLKGHANNAVGTSLTGQCLPIPPQSGQCFLAYLTSIAEAAAKDTGGMLFPFLLGLPIAAGSFYAYVTSLSVLLQVFFCLFWGQWQTIRCSSDA
jgi:hypothetical protein